MSEPISISLKEFSARFGEVHDGLLLCVSVRYGSGGKRHVDASVAGLDLTCEEGSWWRIDFGLRNVSDYKFADKERCTQQVLFHGVSIISLGEKTVWTIDDPLRISDGEVLHRNCEYFAVCEPLSIATSPYDE